MTLVKTNFKLDFLGIGMPKCGTSWISSNLTNHPQVYIPPEKEINFFNEQYWKEDIPVARNYQRGIGWYESFFKKAPVGKLKGEFSVTYMVDKPAVYRIRRHFPDVKILIALRNPPDMVQSLYWWFKTTSSYKYHTDNFDQAVQEKVESDGRFWMGYYSRFLETIYHTFPYQNIHIVILDDIKNNPSTTFKEICNFLQIENQVSTKHLARKVNSAITVKSKTIKNLAVIWMNLLKDLKLKKIYSFIKTSRTISSIYRQINMKSYKYPQMNKKTRVKLNSWYQEDIIKVGKIINRDLSAWYNQ